MTQKSAFLSLKRSGWTAPWSGKSLSSLQTASWTEYVGVAEDEDEEEEPVDDVADLALLDDVEEELIDDVSDLVLFDNEVEVADL